MEGKRRLKMFKYIKYVYDTVGFNIYYKQWPGSDISIWDNCSWAAYKRNINKFNKE